MTLKNLTLEQLNELLAKEEERLNLALSSDLECLIEKTQADINSLRAEIKSRQ